MTSTPTPLLSRGHRRPESRLSSSLRPGAPFPTSLGPKDPPTRLRPHGPLIGVSLPSGGDFKVTPRASILNCVLSIHPTVAPRGPGQLRRMATTPRLPSPTRPPRGRQSPLSRGPVTPWYVLRPLSCLFRPSREKEVTPSSVSVPHRLFPVVSVVALYVPSVLLGQGGTDLPTSLLSPPDDLGPRTSSDH